MVKALIFITLLFCPYFSNAQKLEKGERWPTKKDAAILRKNKSCIQRVNIPFAARIKNYPFNLATQIQLVSFRNIDTSQFQNMKDIDSLPRLNDTVCYSKLKEIRNLTFAQVDKLTDILYNVGYFGKTYISGVVNIGSMTMCYNPRNAILFLDTNGKIFEFIEICFECRKTKESSPKIYLGEMCEQKLGMIKTFFKTAGISYGVVENDD